MRKTLILFDIDGTLLLTGGSGRYAFNQVFEELYGEKNIFDKISPHGRTDTSLIKEMFLTRLERLPSANEIETVRDLYFKHMNTWLKKLDGFHLMPFASETVERLSKRDDIELGLATGNYKTSAFQKLKRGGLDHYFEFGGFGCDSEDRTELTRKGIERGLERLNHAPKEIWVIGDTAADIQAGQGAGAKVIAVATSNTSREDLQNAGANIALNNLSELPEL